MVPECAALPSAICLGRDYPREAFEARIVSDCHENWRIIGHCRDCGQVWLVEAHDAHSRRGGFAIKIPDLTTWTAADERMARIEYLRRSRGDAPAGECMWRGCRRRPLNGIVYCAEHAFDVTGAYA